MGKLSVSCVPREVIEVYWNRCIPHLSKVVDKAPLEISLETIKNDIVKGNTMLTVVSDGAEIVAVNVINIHTFPTGHKVMFIPITGGARMDEWLEEFQTLAQSIARVYECKELRGMSCRKGWLKALAKYEWYPLHEVIGCKVKEVES